MGPTLFMKSLYMMVQRFSIFSATRAAKKGKSCPLPFDGNSSHSKKMFGRLMLLLTMRGSLTSLWVLLVTSGGAVAVKAIIGVVGNSDFSNSRYM